MIYLLYGENETEINKYIDSIMKENNIETKIVYNYKETTIDDVIEECSYKDLFGSTKLVVLNESDFLTGKSTLESEILNKYIDNPTDTTYLIFKVITDKLDVRKKLVKLLKEKSTIKEFKLLDSKNITSYISNCFKTNNYNITKEAINEITKRLSSNTKVIDKELDKLLLYKINEKEINIKDVEEVITKYEDNIIFKLVDEVIKKDKSQVFKTYKKLKDSKEEPSVIIVLLASQFRLMFSAKVLYEKGLDKYKIGAKLKEHPYRVELALNSAFSISKEEIINILYKLAELDIEIKKGETDKYKALEMFLLEV